MANNVVCVVYGHDEDARVSVISVLDLLGLRSVILPGKPGSERTIIELYEQTPEKAAYAVVLLTPEKTGPRQGQELRPRAQQDVVLELGYYLGKLGSGHVCVLVKGDVEPPANPHGVRYMPMDDGGLWSLKLAYEMKEAGMPVDVYRLLV
jgi:predicted nucleotide-binding protein